MEKLENAFIIVRDKYVRACVQSFFAYKRTHESETTSALAQKNTLQVVLTAAFADSMTTRKKKFSRCLSTAA